MLRSIAVLAMMGIMLFVSSAPVKSQSDYALTLKASTLGAEFGFVRAIVTKLNARVGLSYFTYGRSGITRSEDPVAYKFDVGFFAVSALADYHPFTNWFRLSGGVVYNGVYVEANGKAVNTYTVSDKVYTPDEIGVLNGKIEPSLSFTPYVGIGIGNPVSKGNRFNFIMDIGVLYQGSPDVTLYADKESMIYPTTQQETDVEEDLKDLRWYPYFGIGVGYRF